MFEMYTSSLVFLIAPTMDQANRDMSILLAHVTVLGLMVMSEGGHVNQWYDINHPFLRQTFHLKQRKNTNTPFSKQRLAHCVMDAIR